MVDDERSERTGSESMAWTTADIPDLRGRVAVVTGASGGLGLETTRELARKGAHVVLAARDAAKAERARAEILADVPGASLGRQELDVASLDSIHAGAERILAAHRTIDILVNNAGVMGLPERRTVDGFELQLGTNHLGHFALTALLLPALLRGERARVVSVTSTGRHVGRAIDPTNPHLRGRYDPWRAYGQSKLANVHFAVELERRFREAGANAQSLVVHPGLTHTDLQARSVRETGGGRSQRFWHGAVRRFGMSPSEGALTLLRAATDPTLEGGRLYTPRLVNWGTPVRRPLIGRSRSRSAIRTLWQVSERETGIRLDVRAALEQVRAADDPGPKGPPERG